MFRADLLDALPQQFDRLARLAIPCKDSGGRLVHGLSLFDWKQRQRFSRYLHRLPGPELALFQMKP